MITGLGVVAPSGIGVDSFWSALVQGRSGIRKITRFDASSYPCQVAAEVPDFDPTDYMDPKNARRLDRFAQLCFASASMALNDSEIEIPYRDPLSIGVFVGTATGGVESHDKQHLIFVEKGLKRVAPYTTRAVATHSAGGALSEYFGLKGPNTTVSSGCNSGLDACYLAYNAIRLGDANVMVVGAGEAPITPFGLGAFSAVGVLSTRNGDPKAAVRPYDAEATGMVLGEGGAGIVIEELHHALDRGAKIYGEILGYASVSEANLWSGKMDIETISKAFEIALRNSSLSPMDVDYINAHGNGILTYDLAETEAIKKAFGEYAYQIPLSSIKPVTGQSLSPTGIYQIIASLLAMKEGVIPPTLNHEKPAPGCDLNYVPNHPIKKTVDVALMNAHGFGGRHTVLSLSRVDGHKGRT